MSLDCDEEGGSSSRRELDCGGVVDMESKMRGSSLYGIILISDVIEDINERGQAIGG